MQTQLWFAFSFPWWDNLTPAKQLFYGIGLIASLVAIVLMVLSIIGLEHGDSADAMSGAGDHHDGGGIISVKALTGFFLGFGWAGGTAIDQGLSGIVAIALALAAGALFMALMVLLFRFIYSMRSDGTARIEDTVGAVGTVYLTIPAQRGSGGQVTVNFRGRQETYAALCAKDAPISCGEKIKVLSVVDPRTLLVEPLS